MVTKRWLNCSLMEGQNPTWKLVVDQLHYTWLPVMVVKRWSNCSLMEGQIIIRQIDGVGPHYTVLRRGDTKRLKNSYVNTIIRATIKS